MHFLNKFPSFLSRILVCPARNPRTLIHIICVIHHNHRSNSQAHRLKCKMRNYHCRLDGQWIIRYAAGNITLITMQKQHIGRIHWNAKDCPLDGNALIHRSMESIMSSKYTRWVGNVTAAWLYVRSSVNSFLFLLLLFQSYNTASTIQSSMLYLMLSVYDKWSGQTNANHTHTVHTAQCISSSKSLSAGRNPSLASHLCWW